MKYCDVIVPLPLEGLFTYAIPSNMEDKVVFGMRVVVPFGQSKRYTGVVAAIHNEKPSFEVKDVIAVPDAHPVMLTTQYRLWSWIAQYYMSSIGDVYKAAMPAGLKEEEGYKPKTETYVTLTQTFQNEQALRVAQEMLRSAKRQREVFNCFLHLSHWDSLQGSQPTKTVVEITRDELINQAQCTLPVFKALTDRRILAVYSREVGRINTSENQSTEHLKRLSEAQEDAYNAILMQWMGKNVVLLHGVTSSGKTEIYIHLIQKALSEHKQVLYLLPEIALTVQITQRLKRVFGNRMGIYHSRYSDQERVEIWQKQLSSHPYDIILGARSAVFVPFQNLGLVIVDEEHETSFKQQDPAPRYHARSAAIVLAALFGAKTILGTATPSMESYHNAVTGKYGWVKLTRRYKDIQLPRIEVVDTKDLRRRKMMTGPFSPVLLQHVRESLQKGEQAILFQNRRGFAPMITCRVCGWTPKCKHCDVSLTLHKRLNMLTCHYCGYTYAVPDVCPNCGSTELSDRGYGTEKIEDNIRAILPEAKIARMDLDTTRTKGAYERIINDFSQGHTNLLIGTQMVTKGLDFDHVSVVGILNADSMLNYPDFRSYEHAFTMMAQVSGRAGRKGKQGLVILQTGNPDKEVIRQVVANDYEGFYKQQAEERMAFHYPPFYNLIYVYLKHSKEQVADTAGIEMGSRLTAVFKDRVLGPDKPAVARIKSMSIRKLMIKLEKEANLKWVKEQLATIRDEMMKNKSYAALKIYFDVDPL